MSSCRLYRLWAQFLLFLNLFCAVTTMEMDHSSSRTALAPGGTGSSGETQALPMMRAEQALEPASAAEMHQVLKQAQHAAGQAASAGTSQGEFKIQMLESGAMRRFPHQRGSNHDLPARTSEQGHTTDTQRLPMQIKEFPGTLEVDKKVFKPAPAMDALFKQESKSIQKGTKASSAQGHSTASVSAAKAGSNQKEEPRDGFQGNDRDDRLRAEELGYELKETALPRDEAASDDWDDDDAKVTVREPSINPDLDSANATTGSTSYDDSTSDDSAYDTETMPMVNVTAEEDATPPPNTGPLKAKDPNPPAVPPPENEVEKLGEGIGAMAYERSPTGSRIINHDLRQRLQLQDFATIGLLATVFALTIALSCCSVYQVSDDTSPAAYYSEPKNYQQRVICESRDVDAFLAAFNTQPQNVRLRIIGRNPEPGGFRRFLRNLNAHATRPRGLAALLPMRQRRRLSVLFDVALDLTPFITGDGRLSDENLMILQKHLNTNNRLESLLIQKKVDWTLWEDVATNIRQRLRTLGFPGDVEVRFEAQDEVIVYQNHKWSNFVRNRVTQALVVISIIGSAIWIPYVLVRSKVTKIETRFRINVDPSRYWELVSDGLNAAEGFHSM